MSDIDKMNRLRERLNERGFELRQSTGASPPGNLGKFMAFDPTTGGTLIGHRFDATLDEIEAWLDNV